MAVPVGAVVAPGDIVVSQVGTVWWHPVTLWPSQWGQWVALGDTEAIPVGTVVAPGDIVVSQVGTVGGIGGHCGQSDGDNGWHWWHWETLWPSQWGQWVAVGDIVVSQMGTMGGTGGHRGRPSGDSLVAPGDTVAVPVGAAVSPGAPRTRCPPWGRCGGGG